MLLQFLPLIVVMAKKQLSMSRILLFVTFAICISTLFVVDDFNSGFYGAVVENGTGIMPRMRASAQLIAYGNTGRLAVLDYHGEYFLEFTTVHFLSTTAGLDYTLTYFFMVRILAVLLWSLLFVWSCSMISVSKQRLWIPLMAASIMLANQSYNHEISFGPVLLLGFYLMVQKRRSRISTFVTLFMVVGILLASFRETQLLGLMSLIALLVTTWKKTGTTTNPGLLPTRMSFNLLLLIFSFTRTFLLTSEAYAGSYFNYFSRLVDSMLAMIRGSISIRQPILTTVASLQNPLDMTIGTLSFLFAAIFLVAIAIMSARLIMKRNLDSFSLAICLAFIVTLIVPVGAYLVTKTQGTGPLSDFGSATTLARSLAPLAILAIVPHFQDNGKLRIPLKKFFVVFFTIYLSLNLVFVPFLFLRGDTKSTYDMVRNAGDISEYTIVGNHLFKFVTSYVTAESKIRILSPGSGFLAHYELLPLQFEMNEKIEIGFVNLTLDSRIYDNGLFNVSETQHQPSTVFLNELEVVAAPQ